MDSNAWFPIELALVFAAVIVLGGWDLWRMDRERLREKNQHPIKPSDGASEKEADTEPRER